MKFFLRIRRYTGLAMLLHWVVAAGIAFLFVHGFYMMRFQGAEFLPHLNLHRSVGVVVFALVLIRVWWRLTHPPPPLPMPETQAWIAHFVHLAIYALLIVNGIAGTTGWIVSGDPIVFFGYPITGPRTAHPDINHVCILVGLGTARLIIAVVALHVLAVFKHEWFDRDRILSRMLPGPAILLPLHPRQIIERMRERRRRTREERALRKADGAPAARE